MRTYRNHHILDKTSANAEAPAGAFHSPAVFFDEDFWKSNFPRFIVLARRRIATLPWRREFSGLPPGGLEPADYVLKAAELLMSGTRRCRVQYSREACVHGVLDSLISHDAGHVENSFGHDSVFLEHDGSEVSERLQSTDPSIEDTVVARDQLEKYKARFTDANQQHYLDLLAAGACDSVADAAKVLGVPQSEVRNMVKVIRRRRDQWPGKTRGDS